ncbi:hypothetical protein GRJ2_000156300 [Grus japonensis]|uniref:Uncharacterized protein n=1 Tax=Grus japonensis TaxID=30415 RepID=A0ABC9VUZ9_GRUJA
MRTEALGLGGSRARLPRAEGRKGPCSWAESEKEEADEEEEVDEGGGWPMGPGSQPAIWWNKIVAERICSSALPFTEINSHCKPERIISFW